MSKKSFSAPLSSKMQIPPEHALANKQSNKTSGYFERYLSGIQ